MGGLGDLRAVVEAGVTPRVDVYVSPGHDLIHTSLVLTGLCELHSRGQIQLRLLYPRDESSRWLAGDQIVLVCDIHASKTMRVAIDLRDGEGLSYPIHDRVDRYLKRAFFAPERDRQVPGLAAKIAPFGLNYGCRSRVSTVRLLLAIGLGLAGTGRDGVQRLRQYLLTPPADVFEQDPETPVTPAVAFQTRLWREDEVAAGESAPINEERVRMVRALKLAFGARFVGGLVPTPLAREQYPGDLTPHSSNYAEYLRIKKRCLISVYTRGVEHSLAFKLGETFAAAQCLVSVPLRYALPEPLKLESNYLEFETTDACIAACERLLADPALAQEMRRANHRYYREQVEPGAHMARVIADAL